MTHAFAKTGKVASTNRDPFDQYETPEWVTEALLKHVSFRGPILEPAAGTGRICRVLRKHGYKVESADIQRGRDFRRRASWKGDIVSNPPYISGLPFAFVVRALSLTPPGHKVAMLLKPGFLWSDSRREWLDKNRPSTIIVISDRIHFLMSDGSPIKGQFFDHCWMVWGENRPAHYNGDGIGMRLLFEGRP